MKTLLEAAKLALKDWDYMGPDDVVGDGIEELRKCVAEIEKEIVTLDYLTGLPEVNRVEVIDSQGRSYVKHGAHDVSYSLQDNGRTLKVFLSEEIEIEEQVPCKEHPDAPHGFLRQASHAAGRYVCECEHWEPEE